MSNYRFQWSDEKGISHLMYANFTHEMDAWLSALKSCGWKNRLSLVLANERGYTIKNWFDISGKLPILCHPMNYKSDYEFCKKNWN